MQTNGIPWTYLIYMLTLCCIEIKSLLVNVITNTKLCLYISPSIYSPPHHMYKLIIMLINEYTVSPGLIYYEVYRI